MNKNSLNVPIYLNQKIVFDLLASINNGFTQVTKLTTTENTEGGVEAGLGNKNIFALLGVNLKGRINGEKSQEREQEKVHTPSSLFNLLKSQLFKEKVIKKIASQKDFDTITPGEFVEIRGILNINPLIDVVDNIINLIELANIMDDEGNGRSDRQKRSENKKIAGQMKAFRDSLQSNGMVDMICNIKEEFSFAAVLPVYMDYFFNKNTNEIVDGEFRILGKVTKICDANDKISLLRNTSYTLLTENLLNDIFGAFNTGEDEGININGLHMNVNGPALLIIPIAIYI